MHIQWSVCLSAVLAVLVHANPPIGEFAPKPAKAKRHALLEDRDIVLRNSVANVAAVAAAASTNSTSMQTDPAIQSLYATICAGLTDNSRMCASAESMFICNQNQTVEIVVCPSGYVCCHSTNTCNPDNTCTKDANTVIPLPPPTPVVTNASQFSFPTPKSVVTKSGFCKQNKNSPLRVGYITSWGQYRQNNCKVNTASINPKKWTHLIYAFGSISGSSIVLDPAVDLPYVTRLRKRGVKVILSVGGWGAAAEFVNMAATDASRKAFALSAMSIFTQYGFTGIDVDWEFPQSYKDSAGKIIPGSDGDNLGKLLTTLRYYFDMNTKIHYTISLAVPTIPTIYNYPLAEMAKYADFVNVMTYDLNGPWDATALPNTDNRQIKATFDSLVTHAKFPKNKLLLGLAFYGRSYKLTDPASCNGIGCSFVKGGNAYAGACSQTSGYVFMSDILSLRAGGAIARSDATTGTSWLITSDGSWVTFDSYADFKRKDAYAKSICLGGTFVWEIDQDPQSKYTYW